MYILFLDRILSVLARIASSAKMSASVLRGRGGKDIAIAYYYLVRC